MYSYQPFNRLAATSGGSYSYDKNGSLISKGDTTGRWHYYYNGENRLVRVAKGGVGYPQYRSVTYKYDALGRRVSRSDKRTGTTEFTLDGLDVIQDRLSKGGVVTKTNYVNGLNLDERLKLSTDTASQYFLWNHQGSTMALADANGAITAQTGYDSFGNSTVTLPTRYRFTGCEADEFTNLIFYRARYYDPQVGRFISEDPIGFGGGVNWYAYVGNNPLEFTDPVGLDKIKVFNTVGGRKIWDGPTYGNWGGGCFSGGLYSCHGNSPGNAPPVDSSDACYKKHDNCYISCGDDKECMAACDSTLYNDLKSLPDDPRDWPFPPVPGTEGQADFFRDLAKLYFQPPQYVYPNSGGRRHQR
jgi:RHS repeat-associated protein